MLHRGAIRHEAGNPTNIVQSPTQDSESSKEERKDAIRQWQGHAVSIDTHRPVAQTFRIKRRGRWDSIPWVAG